jgi:transposase
MDKEGFLGIDVSKGYADFLLLGRTANVLEEGFQLPDTKDGRQELKKIISDWQVQGLEILYCGVESTGGYENNWHSFLKTSFKDSQVYVCRINPKGVKSVGEASLKRTITDAVSAENIASYMIAFGNKLDYGIGEMAVDDGFKEGRQHMTYIRMLIKQKVQLTNQLDMLLYQCFAEILVYCRHGKPIWLLKMLAKYPSAAAVKKAGAAKISEIRGIGGSKAEAILSKAQNNVQNISPQISHIIVAITKELLHKEQLISEEKQYLTALYQDSEEVKLLTSIPGIGIESAVIIVLEIENIKRFETAKGLTSYFGVHPTFKQSGDSLWGSHMSKKGRGEIRAVLYMATLSGVRYNPILKKVYANFRAKGMKHRQAACVVMHKLLRIIFGILKNKTKFSTEIDEKNQEKATDKQHQKEERDIKENKIKNQQKHRFKEVSNDAPVSRRADQKIKKQIASQAS